MNKLSKILLLVFAPLFILSFIFGGVVASWSKEEKPVEAKTSIAQKLTEIEDEEFYVVSNGEVYSNGSKLTSTENKLSFKNNKLVMVFTKGSDQASTIATSLTANTEQVVAVISAEREEDGITISTVDAVNDGTIEHSLDAEYTLGRFVTNTEEEIKYSNGEFEILSSNKVVALTAATDTTTAWVANIAGGKMKFSNQTYGKADSTTTGRAFYVTGGTLNLNNISVQKFDVRSIDNKNGGAVYVSSGSTVNISGGTYSGNNAYSGGVVYNAGTLSISTSTMTNNYATNCGGVVCCANNNPTTTINSGTFNNNSSSNYAGVIDCYGTVTINNGTFTYNQSVHGGGVVSQGSGTIYINGGDFSHNSISSGTSGGGAILIKNGTFTNTNGIYIEENSSPTYGGGILVAHDANGQAVTINGDIIDNTAATGAGICLQANAIATYGTSGELSSNTASGNGGGIYLGNNSTFTLNGPSISSNSAVNGGGIAFGTGVTFTMNDGGIYENTASGDGGGLYAVDDTGTTTITIVKGDIQNHTLANGIGAGIYVKSSPATIDGKIHITVNITNSGTNQNWASIGNNTTRKTDGGYGGAIYANGRGVAVYVGYGSGHRPVFFENEANRGGAIYMANHSSLNIYDGEFYSNNAKKGGMLYLSTDVESNITGGSFHGNGARYGGCIYNEKCSSFNIESGTEFYQNYGDRTYVTSASSDTYGAVLYGGAYISGGRFYENQATQIFWVDVSSTLTIDGGSFYSNTASYVVRSEGTFNLYDGDIYDSGWPGGLNTSQALVRISGGRFNMTGGAINNCMCNGLEITSGNVTITGGEFYTIRYHAIYATVSVSISNAIFYDCDTAVWATGSTLTMNNCDIYQDGGDDPIVHRGVHASQYTTCTITNCDFTDIVGSGGDGGTAIRCNGGGNTIRGCTFTNIKDTCSGAVKFIRGTNYIYGCTFTNCESTVGHGGAVDVYGSSGVTTYLTIGANGNTATNFVNCKSQDGGSAIYVMSDSVVTVTANISGCTNTSNMGYEGGGAIYNCGTLTINGGTISNNSVMGTGLYDGGSGSGGAIFNCGTLTINSGVTISNNTSRGSGGAIYNNGTLTINNGVTISGNVSNSGIGAAICTNGTAYLNGGYYQGTGTNLIYHIGTRTTTTISGGEFHGCTYVCDMASAVQAGYGYKLAGAAQYHDAGTADFYIGTNTYLTITGNVSSGSNYWIRKAGMTRYSSNTGNSSRIAYSTNSTYLSNFKNKVTKLVDQASDSALKISGSYLVYDYESFTISYTLNGGSGASPSSYTRTSSSFNISNPSRSYYTFMGWSGSNDLSSGLTYTTNSPFYASSRDHILGNEFTVSPGTRYRVWVTAKVANNYWNSLQLQGGIWYTSGSVEPYYGYSGAFTLCEIYGNGWGRYYKDVTVPSGASAGRFYIQLDQGNSGGSTAWYLANCSVVVASTTVTIPQGSTGNRSYYANWKLNSGYIGYNIRVGTGSDAHIEYAGQQYYSTSGVMRYLGTGEDIYGYATADDNERDTGPDVTIWHYYGIYFRINGYYATSSTSGGGLCDISCGEAQVGNGGWVQLLGWRESEYTYYDGRDSDYDYVLYTSGNEVDFNHHATLLNTGQTVSNQDLGIDAWIDDKFKMLNKKLFEKIEVVFDEDVQKLIV